MDSTLPFVETSVYSRLEWQVRHLLKTSGLGIAKGPVGIGKSYSIGQLRTALGKEGVKVHCVTSTPTVEGSHNAFLKAFLSDRGIYEKGVVSNLEAFENLIMGDPFGFAEQRSILIVDESQGMRAPVLTMLRQLWDKGDFSRLRRSGPAFALLLCGNHTFMTRSGAVREMDLLPLRDRITMRVQLKAPTAKELDKVAREFCKHDEDAAKVLAKYARTRGNFRSIAQVYREALELVEDDRQVNAQDIRDAISMMGGV